MPSPIRAWGESDLPYLRDLIFVTMSRPPDSVADPDPPDPHVFGPPGGVLMDLIQL